MAPRSFAVYSILSIASLYLPVPSACEKIWTRHPERATTPKNFGVVLFRALDPLDVYGAIEALQFAAHKTQLNLYMLAETLDPVTSEPAVAAMNPLNSSFWPTLNPTHTFDTAPPLDALIVPGGPGMRAPNMTAQTDFIARVFPSLQYLMTICTGAGLAARSGVLDGRYATTNKAAWATVQAMGPKVKWVAPARWVVDGKVWSSSGVSGRATFMFLFCFSLN